MAWLEKPDGSATVVCVLEQRNRTVWERTARGKSPGRGRARLTGEFGSEAAAAAALETRLAALQSDGFVLIDSEAGIDAISPRRANVPTRPEGPPRLTVNDFSARCSKLVRSLPDGTRLEQVLDAFGTLLRIQPRAFRIAGAACDLTVRGNARVVIKAASKEGAWREVGFSASLKVPEDRETEEECIDADSVAWPAFATLLREDAAWQAVAELPCTAIEVVDDEID